MLLLSVLLLGCDTASQSAAEQAVAVDPVAKAHPAAVAIPDKFGAQIGEDIIRTEGDAVDAAVAAGFSLAVTFIDAGNIGGGGFMLILLDRETTFLDYRETAPSAAYRDMYLDHNFPQYIHLVAEMEKRVFADRAEYPGDPKFVELENQLLRAGDHTQERAATFGRRRPSASHSVAIAASRESAYRIRTSSIWRIFRLKLWNTIRIVAVFGSFYTGGESQWVH